MTKVIGMAMGQTRRKSKLGRYMKALRLRHDPELKTDHVAELARCARPTVTRMEAGKALPRVHLFLTILGVLRASEEEREEALRLWEHANADTTTVEHAEDLPPKYLAFRRDETDAMTERNLAPIAVHGLLQTARYAAAIREAGRMFSRGVGWESRAAEERQSRQKLLQGLDPLRLHALIDEAVIRRMVGGPEVMAEQLRHLLTMGRQANVTIQVVPFGAGAYGPMSGPVTILGFHDPENPDMVYLEYAAGGESVEQKNDVAAFIAMFEEVTKVALSPKKSAELIKTVLNELEEL